MDRGPAWGKRTRESVAGAAMLCVNSLSLGLGILYLLYGRQNIFWNLYGYLMLAAFLGNVGLAALAKQSPKLGRTYLLFSFLWMMCVPFINTMSSIIPSYLSSQSRLSFTMLFSLFILGGTIGYHEFMLRERKMEKSVNHAETEKSKGKWIRSLIAALLSLILFCGLYIVFNLLSKDKDGVFEILVPEYSLFYAIAFLSLGLLILMLKPHRKRSLFSGAVTGATMVIFIACMLPLAYTGHLLGIAEESYTAAFGDAWKTNATFQSSLFRQKPFFMPEYFFGTASGGYQVQKNVVFYEGREGVDEGLVLSFDAYLPTGPRDRLPGGNSVLIRIHGGGWTIGDKGVGNFAQMNKYFANQGYVVFDIQYGLSDKEKMLKFVPVPITRLGSFTMEDMVRHIGIFTTYLADHQGEYGAKLDSVFISGGSAGGQLTLAVGLGIASEKYNHLLDSRLSIKGMIPFYPANGLARYFSIKGKDALKNPIYLVDENSPPCLIYQGTHDGLVPPLISFGFLEAYLDEGNEQCAVLVMPFGSHSSDLYFSGYYNQVFLYYMERFMYQYRE